MNVPGHRGHPWKLENAPRADEQYFVAIKRVQTLPEIRGPNAIHQIIGPCLVVISAIRCFDTQILTALGDSNPHGSTLDLNEAPVVSLVVGEVCRALRHVSREHLRQLLDGAKIDLSRAVDPLDGVGVNLTNVLGLYGLP